MRIIDITRCAMGIDGRSPDELRNPHFHAVNMNRYLVITRRGLKLIGCTDSERKGVKLPCVVDFSFKRCDITTIDEHMFKIMFKEELIREGKIKPDPDLHLYRSFLRS